MNVFFKKPNGANSRTGSALVMVIVLTVLLGLLSALFMMMARVDEISTQSLNVNTELEAGVGAVIGSINEVLVDDIFGTPEQIAANKWLANDTWTSSDGSSFNLLAETMQTNWLHGSNPQTNEPWDYPSHRLNYGGDGETWDDVAIDVGLNGVLGGGDDTVVYGIDDDPWLASLEPEIFDMAVDAGGSIGVDVPYGFRHITDLYGTFGYLFQRAYERFGTQVANKFHSGDIDQDGDRFSMRYLRATIINPADEIAVGDKADADGDGVADSRWVAIPNITSKTGETMYAAVRIIDNGAMININTAYRNPADPLIVMTTPGDWDGSQLSHINLEGIIADSDKEDAGLTGVDIQVERYGTVTTGMAAQLVHNYFNDTEYEIHVARRLLDPVPGYLPFDIGEELELRNRFFLSTSYRSTGVQMRCARAWPVTFNPQANPGKGIPYKQGDDLALWYDKLKPDIEEPGFVIGVDNPIGYYNRRFLSTAYNFSRIARPYSAATVYPDSMTDQLTPISEKRKIPITLPADIQAGFASTANVQNHIELLAMAIYRGLPDDAILAERFAFGDPNKAELAWQMAVNTVDYQDKLPAEEVTTIKIGNTTWFGFEGIEKLNTDTLCISKMGYVNVGNSNDPQYDSSFPPPIGRYFAVEVFNPDDNAVKDLADYEIKILDGSDKLMHSYDIPDGTLTISTGGNNTAVFVFSNVVASVDQAQSALAASSVDRVQDNQAFVSSLAEGWKIVIVKNPDKMPVDCITIPSGLIPIVGTDSIRKKYRKIVMPGTNILLPKWSSATDTDVWKNVSGQWQLGNNINLYDPNDSGNANNLEYPADPNLAGLEKVQLDVPNEQLRNLGEIENVFAVGTRYYEDTGANEYRCSTLIGNILESAVAIKQFDITADQDDAIEMGSFGRIRLDDPDYWPLLDSLTYFDPADTVDMLKIADGISQTSTAPPGFDPTGAALDTLTDGNFFPAAVILAPEDTVNWTSRWTYIQINFPEQWIYGAIVQASGDADFWLEYWDAGISDWRRLWHVPQIGSGPDITGVWTRPEYQDDKRWHLFNSPVLTDSVRLVVDADGDYSVSEIQIGGNIGVDEPYYGDVVAGRININTAPWYVINQLPWIEDASATEPGSLAQAIVAFRDKAATPINPGPDYTGDTGRFDVTDIVDIDEEPGFTNIAELMQVINKVPAMVDYDIRKYIFDGVDSGGLAGPDYTPDGITDDFEERNLLFHRISNLVTVRSDVYTAYILVRVGTDGPQRRVIAIFDRSGIESPDDTPKLVALHRVPDPR